MKAKYLPLFCAAALWASASTGFAFSHPVLLQDQGSFFAGGTVKTAPGTYTGELQSRAGNTLHGDAAYAFYQIPVKAQKNALVFLHGAGQSGKTWETTPDGRDGFQNIFLERGYKTYVVDQPRRGKAGQSTVPMALSAQPQDQLWYNTFCIGVYPKPYANAAVPRDKEAEEQFFYQMTPNTGAFDAKVISSALAAVVAKAGPSVLVTHSQGGGPGWDTAMESPLVKGVISFEPGTFPFPEGQVPAVEKTTSPFPAAGYAVPRAEFLKLTKLPIAVVFGDNIPSGDKPVANWGMDNWRVRKNLAEKWATLVNQNGGRAEIISLPELGLRGNTHFAFADLNNQKVAQVMVQWLQKNKLAESQNRRNKK